jgi:leucyl aminopeptidase
MLSVTYPATLPADATALVVLATAAAGAEPPYALAAAAAAADAASGGAVARALAAARFEGDAGSIVELLAPAGIAARRLLVVGAGKAEKLDALAAQRIGGAIAARLETSGEVLAAVDVAGVLSAELAAHLGHGATLRAWRFDQYRTRQKPKDKPTLTGLAIVGAVADGGDDVAAHHARLAAIADGVARTRTLVSEPANILYPESFVARCADLAGLGVELTVLDDAQMRELGMGALLGVAQGSVRPARILAMRWNGRPGDDVPPVLLVGKGVTFDTGGISLKPAAGMEDMKWDMGGAGAVAGTMHALAARRARAHVVGVVGLVENMPDGNAQRPGDVVTSMNGQTIEVINTDAEGRLVLCDAMWWAQTTFKPQVMVDLATLTGAIIISLGHEHAGMFANDDGLAEQLRGAGAATGEKLWRMPLGDAYDALINSDIADMKNVGPRDGGSITAAQFLARFVAEGVKWAHLDVAGTVWATKPGATHGKGATGFGVRLLDRFIADNHEA